MNAQKHFNLRMLAAAAAVVFALVALVHGHQRLSFYHRQIQVRLHEQEAMEVLKKEKINQRAALAWIEAHYRAEDQLSLLIKRFLPGVKNDLVLRETRTEAEGWTIKQFDMRLDQVSAEKLGLFFAACEHARPPVRLLDVQVTKSRRDEGTLAAQLTLAELSSASLLSPQ